MEDQNPCLSCGNLGLSLFYNALNVPVHSVLLLSSREEALSYPKGDIKLGFCESCGFITNVSFDPSLHEYSSHYEETQGFSSTFSTFHRDLAQRLIERYDLHNKDIIEIGCGKGEFLTMLCELGPNRGVGFDPAFVSERNQSPAKDRMTFVQDLYSEEYSDYKGDFVCCKMTLEHIQHVADFVRTVRRAIGDRKETVVFFQVPDAVRIFRELAFWDIYYEHCSYFSMGSLARLFRGCGFDVVNLAKEYDGQYLMIEARPSDGKGGRLLSQEDDLSALRRDVVYFADSYQQKVDAWRDELQKIIQGGRRAVIWGAGSKGVAFLTKLNVQKEIEYAVDINPYKRGTYMAGTGQEIVGPEFLRAYKPDVVIAMNPIYRPEIQKDLQELGVDAELVAL
jgi:SAM-dependent methyltransferase